ncbi:threonine dehydratase [Micromonospora endolithica]|nr:threonine dehydratase [Micromonospora endolithica]
MSAMTTNGTPGSAPAGLLSHEWIERAQRRLARHVLRTPVVRSDDLDRLAGARLWLKAENLQRGGSFKLRGALLAVGELRDRGSSGVAAHSTGNHAIAVALAAREYGLPAILVLPGDVLPAKAARVREAGAEVLIVGTGLAERTAAVDEVALTRGFDVVDPYQNPFVVAGQGTATAELLTQVHSAGGRLDALVLPVGGGSAVAGACLVAARHGVAVVAAEPAAVPALTAALAAGEPVTVPGLPTVADGLRPDRIGRLPFDVVRSALHEVIQVDEAGIVAGMRMALDAARLVVEPAAACGLAAAVQFAAAGQARDIGVLLTGGNVDLNLISTILAEA